MTALLRLDSEQRQHLVEPGTIFLSIHFECHG